MRKDPTTVSATIYRFPVRGRRDARERPVAIHHADAMQEAPVACVDAWYHQEALQEPALRKPALRLV